jgi:hypothetical protein
LILAGFAFAALIVGAAGAQVPPDPNTKPPPTVDGPVQPSSAPTPPATKPVLPGDPATPTPSAPVTPDTSKPTTDTTATTPAPAAAPTYGKGWNQEKCQLAMTRHQKVKPSDCPPPKA